MSKRTLFLIFALFLITVVLLVMALYQPQASKTQVPLPIKEPVAQTSLMFGTPVIATSSSTTTLKYSLPIVITTGSNKVTAVELQYDPLVLTNVAVTPGPFFPKPIALWNQIDPKTGRISYAFGIGPADQGVSGTNTVATLTFSVKAGTSEKTAIIFLPKTQVQAQGVSQSVLKQTNVGQFTFGINNSTPSAASKL